MARLTATMPVAQAVGTYAALRKHAETLNAQGDPRGLGQLMSDELHARVTGASRAATSVDVEIGLVMTERTLLRGGTDPATLTDDSGRAFAHVPAVLARRLVRQADRAWLSRLYAAPHTGELVAMDSRRRTSTGRLRRLRSFGTRPAGCRGARRPSGTPTTSSTTPWADRPPLPTVPGCASRATTSSRPPDGAPG